MEISVVLAVYNGEKYIKKQLNSLISQTRLPDEVVIFDDCSCDSTFEICESFIRDNALENWFIYRQSENAGYKKNFYDAISKVQGDIIFTCDQDDIWHSQKIEVMEKLFESTPNAYAISSSFSLIDGQDNEILKDTYCNYGLIDIPIRSNFQKIPLKTVMHSNISPGCTSAFRLGCAQLFLKNSEHILPHDYEINLIAAALGGLYFTPQRLISYRLHSSNTLGLDGVLQDRIEIANEKLECSKVIVYASGKTALYDMESQRLEALKKKSLAKIIKLAFNKEYIKILSLKERIGDILYVLRGEKQ